MRYLYLLLALIMSGTSYGGPIRYTNDISPKYYNDALKRQYDMATRIDYDSEKREFYFYIKEPIYLTGFTLSRKQADSLLEAIDKYKEWNLKASKKKVTLEKEIGKVEASQTFWKVGNGDWSFGYGVYMRVTFFSQSEQTHQLVLSFPKFKSISNQYSTHNPETIYFSYSEAMKLRGVLTEKSVADFIKKSKKQAEIETEFN